MSVLIGDSFAMEQLRADIESAAQLGWTVLIEGESGTGKELVARAIHMRSQRRAGPFAAFNCAGVSEALVESELFGHVKGAFTGACGLKKGWFEQARGGTLLLDEIGETMLGVQAKLLRVLQEGEFHRLGGEQPVRSDVRLIAATNRDLAAAVAQREFRADLYYRLNVLRIRTPSLRERVEDIPLLLRHFLTIYANEAGREIQSWSQAVEDTLKRYAWPGNVRELQGVIRRAIAKCRTGTLTAEHLPELKIAAGRGLLREEIDSARQRAIRASVIRNKGNFVKTAQELGVARKTLYKFMRKYGLALAPPCEAVKEGWLPE